MLNISPESKFLFCICTKGVGRGPTLAWPGWKQSVIAVEVDTGRLETSRFKKCSANCVLLYFPSTEIKSAFNVYWHGGGASGLSCTELSIWEFPFLRGVCWQRWTSIWYSEKGMPQKDTRTTCVHLYAFVFHRRLSPQFQFSLSGVTLVYCISMICTMGGNRLLEGGMPGGNWTRTCLIAGRRAKPLSFPHLCWSTPHPQKSF